MNSPKTPVWEASLSLEVVFFVFFGVCAFSNEMIVAERIISNNLHYYFCVATRYDQREN